MDSAPCSLINNNCGESEWVTSRSHDVSLVCRLFCAKGNISGGLKRNFCSSLNYLEVELEALFIIWDYQREKTSFDLSIAQDKLPFTKYLLFLSSWQDPLMPPMQLNLSLAYDVSYTHVFFLLLNLSCIWSLWLSHVCGFPIQMYVLNLDYFLFLICLMSIWLLDQPKEPLE